MLSQIPQSKFDKIVWRAFLLCLLSVLPTACYEQQGNDYKPSFSRTPQSQEQEYIFGVHPLHNPHRLYQVFGPMMDYLSNKIDQASFKLEASRNYAAYEKKLYAKKFHFALPNPFQTINAINKGYKVFGKMADDHNFRGIILIRKDSGINKVADLKNQAVSYPAPTALAATMMPQYYLQTHGIDVMTELDNRYVGSQESAIMNVFLGHTQAASTWPPPWQALRKERPELEQQLMVFIETGPLLNNGLVVLPQVSEGITQQVIHQLTQLNTHAQGRQILSRMELSAFEVANNETYQPIREFIKDYNKRVRPIAIQ